VRAFLIFLIVAGGAAYGFLVVLHDLLPPAGSEYVTADQAEPHQPVRRLTSWGTYLPSQSTSQQSIVSGTADDQSGRASYGSTQPVTHAATSGESQIAAREEPVQASQLVPPSEARAQPSVSSTSGYNTAMDTGVEPPSAKAMPPTRKRRSRITKPATHVPDDAVLATNGLRGERTTPGGERRGLGFFLFGRFAARE
jgi:hypothetical protein